MTLERRSIGSAGLRSSVLGYGAMGLSGVYGAADDHESVSLLHQAVDLGITMFDTADSYGVGHNESLLGRAFHDRRYKVTIATKTGALRATGLGRPEHIRTAIDESLRRLQTDHVDLYYLHRVDPTTPIEETIGAMGELVQAGKVKYLGVSEVSADTLRRAHATAPISAVQQEYSLFVRDSEQDLLPVMRELGIGLVAYSPLGRGILSGAMSNISEVENLEDRQRRYPRFEQEAFDQNVRLVEQMSQIAVGLGLTPSTLALAWVLAKGDDVVPIFGTRKIHNLQANLAAAEVSLDAETVDRLDHLFPLGALHGARYNEALQKRIKR